MGQNPTSRRFAVRSATGSAQEVDQFQWSGWLLIPPPRHVLVGTHEQELTRVKVPFISRFDIEDSNWNAPTRRRVENSRDMHARVEPDKRVSSAECIVERAAAAKPHVGYPTCGLAAAARSTMHSALLTRLFGSTRACTSREFSTRRRVGAFQLLSSMLKRLMNGTFTRVSSCSCVPTSTWRGGGMSRQPFHWN